MKNLKNVLSKVAITLAACFMLASFSPSLDGRVLVVEQGEFPQGLFAKTVGYLPGDIISVANVLTGNTVDLLVIGALDPSEGVAIMVTPEAAQAIGIDKDSNNIVKITKRSGQDERVYGTAVIAKENFSNLENKNESAEDENGFEDEQSEINETEFDENQAESESDEFLNDSSLSGENERNGEFEEDAEPESQEEKSEDFDFEEPENLESPEKEFAEESAEIETLRELGENENFEPVEEQTENFIAEPENDEEFEFIEETFIPEQSLNLKEEFIAEQLEKTFEEIAEQSEKIDDEFDENENLFDNQSEELVYGEYFGDERESEEKSEKVEEDFFDFEKTEIPAEPFKEDELEEEFGEAEKDDSEILGEDASVFQDFDENSDSEEIAVPYAADEVELLENREENGEEDFEYYEYEAITLVPAESTPPVPNETENFENAREFGETENNEYFDFDAEIAENSENAKTEIQTTKEEKSGLFYEKYLLESLNSLESGKYYVQIATLSLDAGVAEIINKYGKNYPIAIVPAANAKKQILIGPLSMDEYALVLERFKSYGYKDAFLRKQK